MMKKVTSRAELDSAYQSLRKVLLSYIYRQVNDQSLAEDLLHDVFIKAIKAQEHNSLPDNLSAWLYTITRNTVIDYYRCKRPTEALPDSLADEPEDEEQEAQLLAFCLRGLAADLPPIYRDTLLATDLGDQTMPALAAEQRISVSAVKSRASRGRKLLKQKLLDCCQVELNASGAVVDFYEKGSELPDIPNSKCRC